MNQTTGQNIQRTTASASMTLAEFEQRLQSTGFFDATTGEISDEPRLQAFLTENPDSAALVRDLQYIAVAAKSLFDSEVDTEPSDSVWSKIQSELKSTLDTPAGLSASPESAE